MKKFARVRGTADALIPYPGADMGSRRFAGQRRRSRFDDKGQPVQLDLSRGLLGAYEPIEEVVPMTRHIRRAITAAQLHQLSAVQRFMTLADAKAEGVKWGALPEAKAEPEAEPDKGGGAAAPAAAGSGSASPTEPPAAGKSANKTRKGADK